MSVVMLRCGSCFGFISGEPLLSRGAAWLALGVRGEEGLAAGQQHIAGPASPLLRHRLLNLATKLPGRVDAGISHHKRDTGGVRAQIDRAEVAIGSHHSNIAQLQTQFF